MRREGSSDAPTAPPTVVVETPIAFDAVEVVTLNDGPTTARTPSPTSLSTEHRHTASPRHEEESPSKHPRWMTAPSSAAGALATLVPRAYRALRERLDGAPPPHGETAPIRSAVEACAQELTREMRLRPEEITAAVTELTEFYWGSGPLTPLFEDAAVTDIWVDGHDVVRCCRRGEALQTPFRFRNAEMYFAFTERLAQLGEKRYRPRAPELLVHLDDGRHTRLSILDPAFLSIDEPALAFHIPRIPHVTFYELVRAKTAPVRAAAWLSEAMLRSAAHIIVTGPGGSGKTTFATALLSAIGAHERIATIETVSEMFPPSAHIEKLVASPDRHAALVDVAERRAAQRLAFGDAASDGGKALAAALRRGWRGTVSCWRGADGAQTLRQLKELGVLPLEPTLIIEMRLVDGLPCVASISELSRDGAGAASLVPLVTFTDHIGGVRRWETTSRDTPLQEILTRAGIALRAPPQSSGAEAAWQKS